MNGDAVGSVRRDEEGALDDAAEGEASPALDAVLARLGRRLLVPLLLALVAVAALALYADGRELARRLGEFDLALLVPVLALSLVNYALRFVRWHLYLLRLDASPGWVDSLWIFLFGFVLTVTPGKVGELGKAWLVRELEGGRGRDGIAAVMAERITDIVGVLVLICLGTLAFPGLAAVAWTGLVVTLALTALLAWPRSVDLLAALLLRIPVLRDRARILVEMHHALGRLLRPGLLVAALMLSIVAWGAEGLGFALVVSSYTGETTWLAGLFDYSVGSMAGGLAMLPGGLVAAEGTLTALLVARGVDAAAAASATLIIRAATLWFAFLLGLGAMPLLWMRLRRRRATERGRR
ncbi:MAG: lysylphosphatidylglycerol synthase transmembrane domain-containing protein [Thermoanaerobaculia bacterium]|nr:lysylphosphatidylglycerol synthase transmembrane domain-containing protein [Thermoanaerobaculia bacterium]